MQTLPALKKKKKIVIHNDLYSDTVTQIHYVKREHNIHVNMYHFDVLYYFTSYTFLQWKVAQLLNNNLKGVVFTVVVLEYTGTAYDSLYKHSNKTNLIHEN